jgi:hypothetical protein
MMNKGWCRRHDHTTGQCTECGICDIIKNITTCHTGRILKQSTNGE